jgi:hypothetical protein
MALEQVCVNLGKPREKAVVIPPNTPSLKGKAAREQTPGALLP